MPNANHCPKTILGHHVYSLFRDANGNLRNDHQCIACFQTEPGHDKKIGD